jgi:hypothetical protein
MGHCSRFGYVLSAIVWNEAVEYKSVMISALGAIAQDLVMRYRHSAGFSYPLWAVVKDLVKCFGPWRSIWLGAVIHSAKPVTIAQKYSAVFKSLPYPLK